MDNIFLVAIINVVTVSAEDFENYHDEKNDDDRSFQTEDSRKN